MAAMTSNANHQYQNKTKRPQADLDTGQRLTPLAITFIFPPSCDHTFRRRASSPDGGDQMSTWVTKYTMRYIDFIFIFDLLPVYRYFLASDRSQTHLEVDLPSHGPAWSGR